MSYIYRARPPKTINWTLNIYMKCQACGTRGQIGYIRVDMLSVWFPSPTASMIANMCVTCTAYGPNLSPLQVDGASAIPRKLSKNAQSCAKSADFFDNTLVVPKNFKWYGLSAILYGHQQCSHSLDVMNDLFFILVSAKIHPHLVLTRHQLHWQCWPS